MQPLVVGDGAPVYAGTFRDNLRSCLAEHSAALSGYNELHVQLIASDGPRASISVVCIEQRAKWVVKWQFARSAEQWVRYSRSRSSQCSQPCWRSLLVLCAGSVIGCQIVYVLRLPDGP